MSFKLSVYEIVAYTVPGILLLVLGGYACNFVGACYITFSQVNAFSWAPLILIGILAYASGLILDRFARLWQHRFFRRRENSRDTLQAFKEVHQEITIHFQSKDWPILLAFLRLHYPSYVVESIEYHNAANIMLRSISLLLVIFSFLQIVFVIVKPLYWPMYLVVGGVSFVSSVLLGKESARRKRWFYFTLYEAVVASSLSSKYWVTQVSTPKIAAKDKRENA